MRRCYIYCIGRVTTISVLGHRRSKMSFWKAVTITTPLSMLYGYVCSLWITDTEILLPVIFLGAILIGGIRTPLLQYWWD